MTTSACDGGDRVGVAGLQDLVRADGGGDLQRFGVHVDGDDPGRAGPFEDRDGQRTDRARTRSPARSCRPRPRPGPRRARPRTAGSISAAVRRSRPAGSARSIRDRQVHVPGERAVGVREPGRAAQVGAARGEVGPVRRIPHVPRTGARGGRVDRHRGARGRAGPVRRGAGPRSRKSRAPAPAAPSGSTPPPHRAASNAGPTRRSRRTATSTTASSGGRRRQRDLLDPQVPLRVRHHRRTRHRQTPLLQSPVTVCAPSDHHRHSAVDEDRLAVHEVRPVRGQPHRRARQVLDRAPPVRRGPAQDPGIELAHRPPGSASSRCGCSPARSR